LSAIGLGGLVQAQQDPFASLAQDTRPLATRWQVDYTNSAELGIAYVSDDNFMFGQYNGLSDDGAVLIGNLDWRGGGGGGVWQLNGQDLGLDTRNALGSWTLQDRLQVEFEFDSQQQVRNNSGRSPFRGGNVLGLPDDWVPANITGGFTALGDSLRDVDLELNRDLYRLASTFNVNDFWRLSAELSYEEKEGTSDLGAAFYTDASSGHAAILPADVDYETTTFDIAVDYSGERLQFNGSWFYSEFENANALQLWQNPYNAFGSSVNYPAGYGGLGQAPDNEYSRLRLVGTYQLSNQLRLQVDGSYARTDQDQNFVDYTVNPELRIDEPLAVDALDSELDTTTLDARLNYRPFPKLVLEARFQGEKRDYDNARNGYRYVPGDAGSQSRSALTVYNTNHDVTRNRYSIEGSYRLPWRSKLWLEYAFEEIERENAAVEETEEDIYRLRYRLQPLGSLHTTLELSYADRGADTYFWDQSYYARRDPELINATPNSQRYSNHPLLSQYHLSNRERSEAKLDISWQPGAAWSLTANLQWRENDYDETDLGLAEDELSRAVLSLSWLAGPGLTVSGWASYDQFETEQAGRNFRGGIEKNAFEIYPPLPQASDPQRNWLADIENSSTSVGISAEWQYRENLAFSAEYSYVNTESEYDFGSGGAGDIDTTPLPDDETEQHHLALAASYALREDLSIEINYQYWSYDQDNWAIDSIRQDTIDKVLTLGEQAADEDLHYIGTSVIYRWR
jgi:MtrB/PioB family decaheme-associated outer membrane protein